MTDLHERFAAWLAEGAPGDPPRDVAVHASGCAGCLARAGAIDELRTIDIGAAELPPRFARQAAGRSWLATSARWAAGATTLTLVVLAVALLVGNPFGTRPTGAATNDGRPAAVAEGVLGTAEGPRSSDDPMSPEPTPAPSESDLPSATPGPTDDAVSTQPPTVGGAPVVAPRPSAPTIPVGTPRQSTPPSAAPSSEPPAPSVTPTPTPATPTPAPTPTPIPTTPTPAPTPSPTATEGSSARSSDCTNGVDDDGDLLADMLEPDCALGTSEADL